MDLKDEALTDLEGLDPEARESAREAIGEMLAHPRAGETKTGRLEGAWSWDFPAFPGDAKEEGRIVYCIQDREIIVFALHADHDEAYKRARARAPRYL